MVSYCPEEKILFSNDAFGQHIASDERFDDELPWGHVLEQAKKYYANIVLPYGMQTQKALAAVSGLDIALIAPSHGVLWRSHIKDIIAEYQKWSTNTVKEEAVIIYDSMWNSTRKMAFAIADGFSRKGIPFKMRCLQTNHISDIMTDVMEAKYICVGSSTLNNNMLPTVSGFLTYLKGLAPKNRIGLAFGSYGWGGQSAGQIEAVLTEMKCELLLEKERIQYVPDEEELKALTEKIVKALS